VRRAGVATTVLPGARRDASFSIHHRLAFDRCLHHADRRRRAPQPQPNARYSTVYHPYSFITGLHGSQRHAGVPRQDGHARGGGDDVRCWGAAYKISPRDAPAVLDLLEIREKQYDQRILVPLHEDASDDAAVVVENALTYVATAHESNLNWLGHAPVDDIAKTIARAVGPSGASYSSHWSPYDRVRVVNFIP